MPLVVLTGETDQYQNLKELYEGTLRIYSKGRDENEMIAFMLAEAEKLDWIRLRHSYADVFAVVDQHLDKEAEQELISCLKEMDNTDFTVIKNSLSCLRRLQEKIYLAVNRADRELLPNRFVGGELNIVGAYKHLSETGQDHQRQRRPYTPCQPQISPNPLFGTCCHIRHAGSAALVRLADGKQESTTLTVSTDEAMAHSNCNQQYEWAIFVWTVFRVTAMLNYLKYYQIATPFTTSAPLWMVSVPWTVE